MKTLHALFRSRRLWLAGLVAVLASSMLAAQTRITAAVNNAARISLSDSLHPMASTQHEAGRMSSTSKIEGITLFFNRSAAQESDLKTLLAAQQNSSSPLYHQWLTPEQVASRFGMSEADLATVKSWLTAQGFTDISIARQRNLIRFSGTVAQVESAFGTQMHYYNVDGEVHYAPSTALSVPKALGSVVAGVGNLNTFKPHAMHTTPAKLNSQFVSSTSGNVFFDPASIKKAYNIGSTYTGAGQTIAVVGQSAVAMSDIENFQSAAGLTVKDPTAVLVPGSGSSTIVSGDETESDLDLEWAGAIAPGAKILFVYTGNSSSYSVFDSIVYAIEENLAPIISVSYGGCEYANASVIPALESIFSAAAAQGQTISVSSGDMGSSGCFSSSSSTHSSYEYELQVDYPASSAYVTAVGGTETTSTYLSDDGTYWDAKGSSDIVGGLLQYLPEVAWNDSASENTLSASGGGVSQYVTKPSWQAGTIGGQAMPSSNGYRMVPDVALYSSSENPGYLICSSDYATMGILNSCSSGFRDGGSGSTSGYLTVIGGTSAAAPVFAGMVALINEAEGYTSGQGQINNTLYSLAANTNYYGNTSSAAGTVAFRDITTGNNECPASLGSTYCSSTTGVETSYSTLTGYDMVTGLGSIDLTGLLAAWSPASSISTLTGTTTSIVADNSTISSGGTVNFTITVKAASGSTSPTGNVVISVDGGDTSNEENTTDSATKTLTLEASSTAGTSTATYSTTLSASGTHQIVARYDGESNVFANSTGIATVVVSGGSSSSTGSFTLSATNVTAAQGSSAASTVTITSVNSYAGTVDFPSSTAVSYSGNATLGEYGCYTINNKAVTAGGTATTALTIYTDYNTCQSLGSATSSAVHFFKGKSMTQKAANTPARSLPYGAVAVAGLLLLGFRKRVRALALLGCLLMALGISMTLSGCGGGGSTKTTSDNYVAKDSYTITLTGYDSTTSTTTASTTFTLTVD